MYKELVACNDPKGDISEAIRTLRTNISFTFTSSDIKTIMITSSFPGEGKSFISANLAYAFSLNNKKVLLIDCDLRKGRIHKIFNLKTKDGITNMLLSDNDSLMDYIKSTNIENLDILPSGMVPPNPSELLNSNRFKEEFNQLKKSYDLIIMDCPPVGSVTDSLVLATLADEAVIVCAYKETPIDVLSDTKKALESSDVKIAGVVINNYKKSKNKYYYYESGR